VCFLFLDPQDEVGPSISSLVVLCSFVLLVYIVVLVLVVCLCPSSVCVVATFSGTWWTNDELISENTTIIVC